MKSKTTTHIRCPHCNERVDIEKAIATAYQEELQHTFDKKIDEERNRVRKETEGMLKDRIAKQFEEEMQQKDTELKTYSEKVIDFNRMKTKVHSLERKNKEMESEIALQYEDRLGTELDKKETLIRERNIQIEQLRSDLEKMQKRASQGSVQLQGEAQEMQIEEWLREEFTGDRITEIKKGSRGADVVHEVMLNNESAGKMCIESKRTKDFQNKWIEKVKDDAKNAGCQVSVIVTDVLPKNFNSGHQLNGVWICTFTQFKFLVHSLRIMLCEVSNVIGTQKNKTSKTSLMFNYVTGHGFRHEVETIVESFVKLQEDLESEKRSMNTQWSKREKQLSTILKSTSNIYGSLKGIAGNSIKQVEKLELPGPTEVKK